jgi:hypothetical protein
MVVLDKPMKRTELKSKTPLHRKTGLKARKGLEAHARLNSVSPKKLEELIGELPIREALIERCGGKPVHYYRTVVCRGERVSVKCVHCFGGTCELCGKRVGRGEILEPHERKFRSHCGKLSLKNTVMSHHHCHMREGHHLKVNTESKPMWSKR